tara:strand:- start:1463 stop:1963 length:501 start_codon:yes stop_codon:yes gene_type:complete
MPDPTFKIDSTTVMSKSGTTVSVDSGLNIKPAFSALDSSASNGPTSGTAVTKSTTLPLFGCRAWVNFDGTSTTSISSEDCCAIRASGNVSKVVRNGTGDYTVNFATAMPDANYAIVGSNVGSNSSNYYSFIASHATAISTSSCRFVLIHHAGSVNDMNYVHIAVFR